MTVMLGTSYSVPAYYLLPSCREHRIYLQLIWGRSNRQISRERFCRPYSEVEFAQYLTLTRIREPAFCNKQKVELSIPLQRAFCEETYMKVICELIIKPVPQNTLLVLIWVSEAREAQYNKIM